MLVGGDEISKMREVLCPLRVPELVGVIERLDLGHVDEDGRGSVIGVFWPFEEEGIALVVDRPMASGREALLCVGKGETPGATCGGGEAERGVVAVVRDGLTYEPEGVVHGSG